MHATNRDGQTRRMVHALITHILRFPRTFSALLVRFGRSAARRYPHDEGWGYTFARLSRGSLIAGPSILHLVDPTVLYSCLLREEGTPLCGTESATGYTDPCHWEETDTWAGGLPRRGWVMNEDGREVLMCDTCADLWRVRHPEQSSHELR